MKMVSLFPAATEMLCLLGFSDELVGVSHECDEPGFVRSLPKVTRCKIRSDLSSGQIDQAVREQLATGESLYEIDGELLRSLKPDVIVTQTLCNVCAVDDSAIDSALGSMRSSVRVIALQPMGLEDVLRSILDIGSDLSVPNQARDIVDGLRQRIAKVRDSVCGVDKLASTVMLEWIDPLFSAGHWSPELIRLAGGQEKIGIESQPSRTIAWQEVVQADPDVLLIACCGYGIERTKQDLPILAKHPGFSELSAVRSGRLYLGDGNAYFNRPGPRLIDTLELIGHALHPARYQLPQNLQPMERWAWSLR
jgi:iron complex transport system substrate-binding protein